MAINLYIGPDLRFSVTPHTQPTFDELIHNGSLSVPIKTNPITHVKSLSIQVTVSSNGAQASGVNVKLFVAIADPTAVTQSTIDQTVLNMIAGNPLTSWLGLTILSATWTSGSTLFVLPNETNKVCLVVATVECSGMPTPGPSLPLPTLDKCVGIYVKPFGTSGATALNDVGTPSGIGVATSLGLLGLNWIIDRRDRLRNGSPDSGILFDPKKRNRK